VHTLIVGSNSNDILTRFFESHEMLTRPVVPTLSPSMDIQISSNFERLLFEMNGRDGGATSEQLQRFRSTGSLAVEPDQYATWIAPTYRAHRCTDDDTLATVKRVHAETGMLIDPHTAIGVAAAEACREPGIPVITLATAHPAKFPDAVERATGVRPPLPAHVADLFERTERIVSLPNDLRSVEDFVAAHHSA
jgi:threonine synthase